MSLLFVDENGATIGINGNRFYVDHSDGMRETVPAETLECISIMGNAKMTTQSMQECLKRGISVVFYSKGGKYFGKLVSTCHINAERQRKQCALYGTDFSLDFSKRIITAKMKNQLVVMKRYAKSKGMTLDEEEKMLHICVGKIDNCTSIDEIMGYEGQGAKAYFQGLSKVIKPDFSFNGRSRRPPLDEFNTMIGLGYSVLMNEIYAKIEVKGLNPYFGYMHSDKENHPTLASDLMEEWRAVIVDATAMSMINGNEIDKEDFLNNIDEPGCYLAKTGIKKYLPKLERKLKTEVRYLDYITYATSFRRAMFLQIEQLVKAIEEKDATLYHPIQIR